MLRVDELDARFNKVRALKDAVDNYDKMKTLISVSLYFNGHRTMDIRIDTAEFDALRDKLVERAKFNVESLMFELRRAGIDPCSANWLPKEFR